MRKIVFSLLFGSISLSVNASILWQGNFETGDQSQWNTAINPVGLSVITEFVCFFYRNYSDTNKNADSF